MFRRVKPQTTRKTALHAPVFHLISDWHAHAALAFWFGSTLRKRARFSRPVVKWTPARVDGVRCLREDFLLMWKQPLRVRNTRRLILQGFFACALSAGTGRPSGQACASRNCRPRRPHLGPATCNQARHVAGGGTGAILSPPMRALRP